MCSKRGNRGIGGDRGKLRFSNIGNVKNLLIGQKKEFANEAVFLFAKPLPSHWSAFIQSLFDL